MCKRVIIPDLNKAHMAGSDHIYVYSVSNLGGRVIHETLTSFVCTGCKIAELCPGVDLVWILALRSDAVQVCRQLCMVTIGWTCCAYGEWTPQHRVKTGPGDVEHRS